MSPDDRPPEASHLRALPVAVVVVDRGGTIRDLSDRAARELGRPRDELLGADLAEQLGDAPRDGVLDALGRVPAAGSDGLADVVARFADASDGGVVELVLRMAPAGDGIAVVLDRRRPSTGDLLAGILEAVSSTSVGVDVVERALQEVGSSHDWERAALWVLDPGVQLLRPAAVWGRDPEAIGDYRRRTRRASLARGDGLPGRAWEAGVTLYDADVEGDERFGADGLDVPVRRVHHPIAAGGQVVGVIELLADSPNDPAAWVESALVTVEPALGHLLERFRDRLAVDAAEGRLAAALDAGQFGVATVDVGSGRVEWSSRMADLHGQTGVRGAGPLSALLAAVHPDDQEEIRTALRSLPGRDEDGGLPMRQIEYRVVDGEERWLSTRITATELPGGQPQVAAITSDVTARKRNEEHSQRRTMAIEGLQWVSQAIIAGRELRDTAVAVAHAATGVLGASLGVILYQVPGDTADELAWALSGLPPDAEVPDPPGDLVLPADLEAAEGASVVDLRTHPDVRAFVLGLGLPAEVGSMRSSLIVPIRGEGRERLGTMVFLHDQAGYFTDDDVRLARSIGSSTGVAVENAKRHEQQRLAATAFQRELLPSSDAVIPGAEVCVRYHPGRDGIEVGGDWYDVITLDDERVGLAVGDVCGHGLTAAAHMGQFRHSFRALVQSSISPEEALRVLNRLALEELHTTMTIVYVELDTRTGECRSWRCGHLPPVIADRSGEVRWMGDDDHRGPLLGFVPDFEVPGTVEHLAPGELLLLYTDGLVERRGESIQDGLDRLAASFSDRSPEIDSTCDELYQLLADQGPTADDTAILAVRRH